MGSTLLEASRNMSDLGGEGLTPSFNQSSIPNPKNINDSTQCDQVDTSAHVFFMLVYSLVFLVSLKYSESLCLCLRKQYDLL